MKITCYRLWYNHRNYDIKQLRDATMILTIFCITYLDVQVRSNVETFNVLIKKHIFSFINCSVHFQNIFITLLM